MLKNEILKELREYKSNEFIEKIGLFGSIATDNYKDSSDIDILLSFKQIDFTTKEKLLTNLKLKLENSFKRKVDILDEKTIFLPTIKKIIEKSCIYA
jgi:uncharacterized protein